MDKIIGVRLKQPGKIEYYDTAGVAVQSRDCVVVDTGHGPDVGYVMGDPRDATPEEVANPAYRAVQRKAQPEDLEQVSRLEASAREAVVKCRELARKLNLAMKPICAYFNLDGTYLTIYFTAEQRVDFRDLVKELRHQLRARVELRQVGPRDQAKLVGAVGRCGRRVCCMSFIDEFMPISIKMAKDQELSLSPMKVSGMCGRLLCCLGYEAEHYRRVKEKSPRVGQEVTTPSGRGRAVSINSLRETVLVDLGGEAPVEFPVGQLVWEHKGRKEPHPDGKKEGAVAVKEPGAGPEASSVSRWPEAAPQDTGSAESCQPETPMGGCPGSASCAGCQ